MNRRAFMAGLLGATALTVLPKPKNYGTGEYRHLVYVGARVQLDAQTIRWSQAQDPRAWSVDNWGLM